MDVQLLPPDALTPYPDNPRHNDAAVDAVAESLRRFGFRQPIVVDADHVIVVGHTRWKAAKKIGLAQVPVHVARDLTPDQARAYRLADNQTATLAAWDDDALARELLALRAADLDLSALGFAADDLARLLDAADPPAELADPDDAPPPPPDPVTRPGDVWALGPHRLLCGDATRVAHVRTVMAGEPADLLLTDPPYGVSYTGGTADQLTIANDDLDEAELRAFLADAFRAAAAVLKPGGGFYLWHADSLALPVRLACGDAGLRVRQGLVWVKNAFTLGRQDYQWAHEPCLAGWADGAAHTWLGGRDQSTVLRFDKPAKSADHPTMKPVALFERLVENSCRRRGTVLDPFAGSGTTLTACHRTGRVARLVELDPRYCDVIVRRWEGLTGTPAVRVAEAKTPETLSNPAAV